MTVSGKSMIGTCEPLVELRLNLERYPEMNDKLMTIDEVIRRGAMMNSLSYPNISSDVRVVVLTRDGTMTAVPSIWRNLK